MTQLRIQSEGGMLASQSNQCDVVSTRKRRRSFEGVATQQREKDERDVDILHVKVPKVGVSIETVSVSDDEPIDETDWVGSKTMGSVLKPPLDVSIRLLIRQKLLARMARIEHKEEGENNPIHGEEEAFFRKENVRPNMTEKVRNEQMENMYIVKTAIKPLQSKRRLSLRVEWTDVEHTQLVQGIQAHGRKWRKVQEYVPSKSCSQVRTYGCRILREEKLQGIKKDQEVVELANIMNLLSQSKTGGVGT